LPAFWKTFFRLNCSHGRLGIDSAAEQHLADVWLNADDREAVTVVSQAIDFLAKVMKVSAQRMAPAHVPKNNLRIFLSVRSPVIPSSG
jgi:hypothetical protein